MTQRSYQALRYKDRHILENNALLEINDKEWIDYDIPKSLVAVDKVMIVIGKHT